MQFFFVGLAMRSRVHDYKTVHQALFAMRARRVSTRIWLCSTEQATADTAFAAINHALASEDEMLVVEVPQDLRGPRLVSLAA